MPLHRRIPKRGFKNIFAKKVSAVNIRDLNRFDDGTEVTPQFLVEQGLTPKSAEAVKILGHGELTKKLSVTAHAFSRTAEKKIEAAGGTVKTI